MDTVKFAGSMLFLSTLSLRRATAPSRRPCRRSRNFYPRSPCGERLFSCFWCIFYLYISIHALLAESDSSKTHDRHKTAISIHALLAESDGGFGVGSWRLAIFLSTLSLRRATVASVLEVGGLRYFYPRSPCGERQKGPAKTAKADRISIHALLAESDRLPTALRTPHHRFLSTLSLRRATILVILII